MKVLINSYACSPYKGSEPGMGWNFVDALSRDNDLYVITEKDEFEEDIARFYEEHPERKGDIHFFFVKRERTHPFLLKIWPPSYYWTYRAWQKKVLALATQLDSTEHFDVVHQLNMAGYREPGYLWKMDKPFVWGPIGGFGHVPWRLIPTMRLRGIIFYTCHNIINFWQMHTMQRVRKAMKKADALIAATALVQERIKILYNRDSYLIPEVGLVKAYSPVADKMRIGGGNIKLCWSGLHIPRKALNLLLDALHLLHREDIELHVLGSGSETVVWKKKADKYGLKNVIWYGQISRDKALEVMQSCDIFCITSLSDLTSTVILEALSMGMPVIALNHCGFKNVLNDSCGRKIDIGYKSQVVRGFADAITELVDDRDLLKRLSDGARKRALEYKWEDKAKLITSIYKAVAQKE